MENMVNVYFFGKKYTVPADLTIMTAMEYAGYTLKEAAVAATDSAAPAQPSTESKATTNSKPVSPVRPRYRKACM